MTRKLCKPLMCTAVLALGVLTAPKMVLEKNVWFL